MVYIRCPFCGIFTQEFDHVSSCPWDGWNDAGEPETCFSCGKTGRSYSASQWTSDQPRCKTCVGEHKTSRHQPFFVEAFQDHPCFDPRVQALRSACLGGRYEDVVDLLEQGVDPRIVPVKTMVVDCKSYIVYDERGQAIEDRNEDQPFTLLRACVFGISNILLDQDNLWNMSKIASCLIARGLDKEDKEDAKAYFESRYGIVDETANAASDHLNASVNENEGTPFQALYDVLSE